jgi:hypothetical protein
MTQHGVSPPRPDSVVLWQHPPAGALAVSWGVLERLVPPEAW